MHLKSHPQDRTSSRQFPIQTYLSSTALTTKCSVAGTSAWSPRHLHHALMALDLLSLMYLNVHTHNEKKRASSQRYTDTLRLFITRRHPRAFQKPFLPLLARLSPLPLHAVFPPSPSTRLPHHATQIRNPMSLCTCYTVSSTDRYITLPVSLCTRMYHSTCVPMHSDTVFNPAGRLTLPGYELAAEGEAMLLQEAYQAGRTLPNQRPENAVSTQVAPGIRFSCGRFPGVGAEPTSALHAGSQYKRPPS